MLRRWSKKHSIIPHLHRSENIDPSPSELASFAARKASLGSASPWGCFPFSGFQRHKGRWAKHPKTIVFSMPTVVENKRILHTNNTECDLMGRVSHLWTSLVIKLGNRKSHCQRHPKARVPIGIDISMYVFSCYIWYIISQYLLVNNIFYVYIRKTRSLENCASAILLMMRVCVCMHIYRVYIYIYIYIHMYVILHVIV